VSNRLSFLPRFIDAVYGLRVDAVVDAVVAAGGVAVVAAHGQVASPSLRVKKSHSADLYGRLLSICKTSYMLSPWSACMVSYICFVLLALETGASLQGIIASLFKQNPTVNTGSSLLNL